MATPWDRSPMFDSVEIVREPTKVAAILDASAVAFWSEVLQRYICKPCRRESRVISWQAVDEDCANAIAKDCGRTRCDACGEEIR